MIGSKRCMAVCYMVVMTTLVASSCRAQKVTTKEVSFRTSDDGRIHALSYGDGTHGVVLAHGAIFNKESWAKQSESLAQNGFRVLAIDFRGYGDSRPGTESNGRHLDVLAAVRYLKANGAERVSVVGGSMGGGAAAQAAVGADPDEIDRLILLAHSPVSQPQKLRGNKLFIVSRGDSIRASVQKQYETAPQPKKLLILDGSAHAQHIFGTEQAETLLAAIVDWLSDDTTEE